MSSHRIQVLAFSGSLRKGSYNTGLLRAAAGMLPEGMAMETVGLASIPLYNADFDGPQIPEAVVNFKRRIASSDALLIATPEYNYSVPGVLKNAIDWASRPPKESPLTGKPVAILGAGGVMGTVRAQLHLRQVLLFNGALVMPKPEVYISRAKEKFDADGNLIDEQSRESVRVLLSALFTWALRFRSP